MAKTFDYRAFYEEKTGVSLPSDFDIHHLDFDRENNSIDNLVAIPKELHLKYHAIKKKIDMCMKGIVFLPINNAFAHGYSEFVALSNEMLPIYLAICHYGECRDAIISCLASGNLQTAQYFRNLSLQIVKR